QGGTAGGGTCAPGGDRTEEHFGTEQELKELVDKAHARGIKVLFDYAMVHVFEESPLYTQHRADGWFTPKYAVDDDGFYIDRDSGQLLLDGAQKPIAAADYPAPDPAAPAGQDTGLPAGADASRLLECLCSSDTLCNWDGIQDPDDGRKLEGIGQRCWFQGYLPHLDYRNPQALDYSLDAAVRLATEMGADGYRLDAVKHIDEAWYKGARARMQAEFPDRRFYLVGETYDFGSRDNLKRFIGDDKLDGQFDFPLRAQLARAVLKRGSAMVDLARFVQTNDGYYGCNAVMSPFIGNHDIGRAIHVAEDTPLWDEYSDSKARAWLDRPSQPTTASPYERRPART
ncbi:MAG: hypothetical protein EOO75_21110, partial [Myxococcales bacterium]